MFFNNKKFSDKSNISTETLKKLSKKNIKNNYKDYLIYFITLTFGICLLYTFNTIDKQFDLFGNHIFTDAYLYTAQGVLLGASVIISLIFAFLINYANQFLMKKRKKEFGIYISLGMNKKDIIKLMYKESLIIGLLALFSGVIAGVFVEQGISILTNDMLGFDSTKFRFSISILALIKTALLFILVLWFINKFNIKAVQKYTLLELLKSNKKNECKNIRNSKINFIIFITSLILIFCGYLILIRYNFSFKMIALNIVLISIGTYLFFNSVSDFLIHIITKRKSIYFRNLNMFVLSQISSRIKSINLTITVICLLLFLSMTIIPSGLGISNLIRSDLEVVTPYDVTVSNYIYDNSQEDIKPKSIIKHFIEAGAAIEKLIDSYSEISLYTLDNFKLKSLDISNYINTKKSLKDIDLDENVYLMKVSDYNKARVQQGLKKVNVKRTEYIFNSFDKKHKDIYENYISKNKNVIDINGIKLLNKYKHIQQVNYQNSVVVSDTLTIIIPDFVLDNLSPSIIYLNVNYPELTNEYDNEFLNMYMDYKEDNYNINSKIVIGVEKVSINTTLSYISIYLGIIFLITAGAILSLEEFSTKSLNIKRYNLLKRLGVRKKDRQIAMLIQVLTLFLIPFIVATVHSIFINGATLYLIKDTMSFNIIRNFVITIVTVIVVYGTYFIISYNESKTIQ